MLHCSRWFTRLRLLVSPGVHSYLPCGNFVSPHSETRSYRLLKLLFCGGIFYGKPRFKHNILLTAGRKLTLTSGISVRCPQLSATFRLCFSTACPSVSHSDSPVTIVGLASGASMPCAVAIIRVSGPRSHEVVQSLLSKNSSLPAPRTASLVTLYSPNSKEILDKCLILPFIGPQSFTGEDVVELHVHGGRAVVHKLLSVLTSFDNVRTAEPGEFTRRAFDNGKLDLTEVEGLADLLEAETEAQRKQALRQYNGELSRMYESWRQSLIESMAHVEALLDFPEEEDVNTVVDSNIAAGVTSLMEAIKLHLNDGRRGEIVRNGASLVILGSPNAGKSSLINVLANRSAAIVSPIPGTTRDVVEVALDIGGYPVVLGDTAGLRDTDDIVEQEGVRRAKERSMDADVQFWILDGSSEVIPQLQQLQYTILNCMCMSAYTSPQARTNRHAHPRYVKNNMPLASSSTSYIVVINKKDLLTTSEQQSIQTTVLQWLAEADVSADVHLISCKTKEGIPNLLSGLQRDLESKCPITSSPTLSRVRHRELLESCVFHLDAYLELQDDTLCAAEELRMAANALGKITGRIDTEEILGALFSQFCIGK